MNPVRHADLISQIDTWFASIPRSYNGRLPANHSWLAGPFNHGWLFRWRNFNLCLLIDSSFPFSKPIIRLIDSPFGLIMPHVEEHGKLCLLVPESPHNPIAVIESAIGEAIRLLKSHHNGEELDDFQNDFALYWSNYATEKSTSLYIQTDDTAHSRSVYCFSTTAAIFVFDSKKAASDWFVNRYQTHPTKIRQAAVIELRYLPSPNQYPTDGISLWKLIKDQSVDGIDLFSERLKAFPKSMPLLLSGKTESGKIHIVGLVITRPPDKNNRPINRRYMLSGGSLKNANAFMIASRSHVHRLVTRQLNSSLTRLPSSDRATLRHKRVAVIGCGAIGSGIARMLAKAGVGNIVLIDPEILGWENIRRHEIGASGVGFSKSELLSFTIKRDLPDISSVSFFNMSVQQIIKEQPDLLLNLDLVISSTGSTNADLYVDQWALTLGERAPPVIYSWMEAFGLASHAVIIKYPQFSLESYFDASGNFRFPASYSPKVPAPECGVETSPFGVLEVSQAQSLASRLTIEFLRGMPYRPVWRTWLVDQITLDNAGGSWIASWIDESGPPSPLGCIQERLWQPHGR